MRTQYGLLIGDKKLVLGARTDEEAIVEIANLFSDRVQLYKTDYGADGTETVIQSKKTTVLLSGHRVHSVKFGRFRKTKKPIVDEEILRLMNLIA